MDVRFAGDGLRGFKALDVSTLAWAFAHLGHRADGLSTGSTGGPPTAGKGNKRTPVARSECANHSLRGPRPGARGGEQRRGREALAPRTLVSAAWPRGSRRGGRRRRASPPRAGATSARGRRRARPSSRASTRMPTPTASRSGRGAERPTRSTRSRSRSRRRTRCGGGAAAVLEAAANAWTAQRRPPVVSWYQRDVASILSYMGERHEDEARARGTAWICSCRTPWGSIRARSPGGGGGGGRAQPFRAQRRRRARADGLKRAQFRKLGFAVASRRSGSTSRPRRRRWSS